MNLANLSTPLSIDQIDFRIQSINLGGYATILAYKDARVDMQRLDDVCGRLNWKREHTRDNKNCIISIWDDEKKQWVGKEDTGVESNTEKEKGLASDSFKRAGFNWGIGRELYDYPIIQIKLNPSEFTKKKDNKGKERAYATWDLKLREWKWVSQFNEDILVFLQAKDNHDKVRFTWKNDEQPPKHDKKQEDKDFNNFAAQDKKERELLDKYELELEAAFKDGVGVKWWEGNNKKAKAELGNDFDEFVKFKDVLKIESKKDVGTHVAAGDDLPL